MKICRICPIFHYKKLDGGLKPYFYNITAGLEERGVNQEIIALDTDCSEFKNIRVHLLPRRQRLTIFRIGLDAFDIIEKRNVAPDLIHTHNADAFMLYHFKRKLSVPMVHTMHGSPFAYKLIPLGKLNVKDAFYVYFFNKYACKKADAIITVSSEERERVISGFKISPEKVHYIPTAVNTDIFSPKNNPKDIDILYAGRFAMKKNIPALLMAVNRLKQKYPNISVWLVGGESRDADYQNIMQIISKCGLSSNVHITGPIKQEDLAAIYNRTKIFALLSYEEGLPKVVLEAMACGVPVVATAICGNKDAVVDGETGFLVKNDIAQIAEKIDALLSNDGLRKDFSGQAAKRISTSFTWKHAVDSNLKVYEGLLAR